jgi:uncharacterized membrane-anchored protein YhcB (DUF1043 family)
MEISFLWLGIGAMAMFGVGLFLGLFLGRTRQGAAQREAEELKTALRQNQEELRQYRAHVARHFTQTADLLQSLTANYRAVYEHLAAGAQTLCNGQVRSLTPEALREHFLTTPSEEGAQAEAPAPQLASPVLTGERQSPLTEEGHDRKLSSAPTPGQTEAENT